MTVVYYEKSFVSEHEAKIPLSDRGFQCGDGAYATIQVRDGVALFLEEHLERLDKQCLSLQIHMPLIEKEVVEELITLNRAFEGIWRMKIFVTGGDGAQQYLPERNGRVAILLKPFVPESFKPLNIEIFSVPYYSCHAGYKSLAHLNRYYVMQEARIRGVDDCVTSTEKGYILEAAFGNVFWVKEKQVITPDPCQPLYFGVTITNVLNIARNLGFEICYAKLPVTELPQEAAAFRTNTMQGIRPIAQIGKCLFNRNATIESLFINSYEQLIEEQKKRHAERGVRKIT